MGRTAEPRSWRAQIDGHADCPVEENTPLASTSFIPPTVPEERQERARPTRRLAARPSYYIRDAPVPESHTATVTEQLRRSVLPASTSAPEPPWRVAGSTSFGRLASNDNDTGMPSLDTSHIRISRSARASWNAAFNETQGLPDSSNMLPPRLGTPVPTGDSSTFSIFPATTPTSPIVTEAESRIYQRTMDEALTTIGRRALARHRLSMLEAETTSPVSPLVQTNPVSTLVQSLNLETLERAQLAVEGSRIALEQARVDIRMALRNSETRLGRLADLIRSQLQTDTSQSLPPLPRSTAPSEIAAERSEYNLERSLANLRAASLEIDRVLADSQGISSRFMDGTTEVPNDESRTSHSTARDTGSALFVNLSLPPLFQSPAHESFIRSSHQRAASASTSATEPALAEFSESPLRQPIPRRPIRYLRGSQIPSVSNLRSRTNTQEPSASRANRPQRSASNRSLAVQVSLVGYANDSTSNLARNVLNNVSQRSTAPDEEALTLSDDDGSASPMRPTGYRQIGRWIRLDANGDEIVHEHDSRAAPLGWSWASMTQQTPIDEEKPVSLASDSNANSVRTGQGSSASQALETLYDGDLVGR